MDLEQHIGKSCVNPAKPLDPPYNLAGSGSCKPGEVEGHWNAYSTAGSPFTATDQEYNLAVIMPPEWVETVTSGKTSYSNPRLLIRGREVAVPANKNVWVGHFHPDTDESLGIEGEYEFLDEARTAPISIALSVDRKKGGGQDKLWPAYMLIIVDITDANGNARRLSGTTLTRGINQGSAISCESFLSGPAGGTTIWNWTKDELCNLGYGAPSTDPTLSPYCA